MTKSPVVSLTDDMVADIAQLSNQEFLGPKSLEFMRRAIADLISERAELKKDADRYRWLRSPGAWWFAYEIVCQKGGVLLDVAIDAAMECEK